MLNQILAFTWKDLKIFFKDPGAVALIFLQPFMFIVVMSYALGGLFEPGKDPIRILVVNQDMGTQAATIIRQLDEMEAFQVETAWEGQPLTREMAEKLILQGKRNLALVFPPDFSEVLAQDPGATPRRRTRIWVIVDPATSSPFVEPILGTLQGLIERSTYTAMMPKGLDYLFTQLAPQVPPEQREAFKARAQEAMSGGLLGGEEPVVALERTAPPGMRVEKLPNTFQQNVPGYTIYGVFWIVSLLAGSVLQEKREGTFRRLLAAPMSRAVMLTGKLLPYYLINLIQIAIMLGASSWLFGLSLGRSPLALLAVSLAAAAAATGLGVLVAAIVRTEAQAGGLTVLLLLTMSALGGCFVPRFVMPDWLQTLGLLTPHAWALDAYQDLLVRGYGLQEVWPKVGALTAFAAAFFGLGVWRFRFD
ncbi:ABC transporter permease [Thermoflexus hugenholtzii]|uniref:ABC-2 type transport system permease protein n=1 Tax=Thermoflexus hugenholtzii JAD2 TaxID=877466 RepID=A0A212RIZ5_9CHLR|nr:ABC transporter permease [Thermoflexus hugenholtzii]SNB72364.1 ABC-2 type transport system permease protein [Thermoflexus hugenholtzii JAD2]